MYACYYYLFHSKGVVLRPFSKVTRRNGEPLRAVLISWFFVQVKLCFRILVIVQSYHCRRQWHAYSKKGLCFLMNCFIYILTFNAPNKLIRATVTYREPFPLYMYRWQRNIFSIMYFFFRKAGNLRFCYTYFKNSSSLKVIISLSSVTLMIELFFCKKNTS